MKTDFFDVSEANGIFTFSVQTIFAPILLLLYCCENHLSERNLDEPSSFLGPLACLQVTIFFLFDSGHFNFDAYFPVLPFCDRLTYIVNLSCLLELCTYLVNNIVANLQWWLLI